MPRRVVKKKKTRVYDNSSRLERTKEVSKFIVETLVELLVESRGADVPLKEVSKRSKVPMRTIFRLFKDKEALQRATDDYLTGVVTASMNEIAKLNFLNFAKNTYSVFDRNNDLVSAYLFSSFGRSARDILRRRFNKVLRDQILKERPIRLNKKTEQKLALIVSLVSARLWFDLKTDFGYSGEEMGSTVAWALECLLKDLEVKS